MDDSSIRGAVRYFPASACTRLVFSFPRPLFPIAPGPLLQRPQWSWLTSFLAPSLVPVSTVARGPGRANTGHWIWIPRPGGPPSLHPRLRKGEISSGSYGTKIPFVGTDAEAMRIRSAAPPGCAKGRWNTLVLRVVKPIRRNDTVPCSVWLAPGRIGQGRISFRAATP